MVIYLDRLIVILLRQFTLTLFIVLMQIILLKEKKTEGNSECLKMENAQDVMLKVLYLSF